MLALMKKTWETYFTAKGIIGMLMHNKHTFKLFV